MRSTPDRPPPGGSSEPRRDRRTVDVRRGCLELRGTVRTAGEAARAEQEALEVPGVRAIRNQLIADPRRQGRDERRARQVRAALLDLEDLPADQIEVVVANDTAVLTGRVEQDWQRALAEAAVRQCPVREVENRVDVRAWSAAENGMQRAKRHGAPR